MAKKTLEDLLDEVYKAKRRYCEAIDRTLGPGDLVTVIHGDNHILARVVSTSGNGEVRVRNPSTFKEYWVAASRLVEYSILPVPDEAPTDG